MDQTPTISRFEDFYKNQTPPWVIGEPQPAVVALVEAGAISGRVLDVGCGTGEHTILLARAGYDVLGVDGAPTAVGQARRNAADQGVDARFEVADALDLGESPGYDTIVDSALFHIFDDGRTLIHDGPEGGPQVRAIIGGMGDFSGASGEVFEEPLGTNSTGLFNIRFTVGKKSIK